MAIGIEYPHIEKIEGQPARLAGHPRIRIAQLVMDDVAHGWSAEEMCRQHEYLSLSDAHAAMLYYWDHRDELDGEIREELENYDRERDQTPATPLTMRLRAIAKPVP